MAEERKKRTYHVKIYGKEYSIRSVEDSEYVEEVARYVDSKMLEIDRSGVSSNPAQAAILAALNITDELFGERAQREKLAAELLDRSKGLVEKISATLASE
jgi:cell division protein ZapA